MSKIALLVLCANAPSVLNELISSYKDSQFAFYIHVDLKGDQDAYLHGTIIERYATVLDARHAVYWGGYSMVLATISLMRQALQDPDIASMALISDDAFPMHLPDDLYKRIMAGPNRITCWKVPAGHFYNDWYDKFFYFDSNFSTPKWISTVERAFADADWTNLTEMQELRKRGKKKLEQLYAGRQWWVLHRPAAEALLGRVTEDSHLADSFRFSAVPDELFFHNFFRACFPQERTLPSPMLDDFSRAPKPFRFDDRSELLSLGKDHHLFVRKVTPRLAIELRRSYST